MKKNIVIEVYCEDNTVIIKDLHGKNVEIKAEFDELTIEECIHFLFDN